MTTTMKVEGPLHVICQCDKCKPQIAFNAEVVGYVPPPREWVGLTDEEIWKTISRIGTSDSDVNPYTKLADARAIEAKLKEKNT